MADENLGEVLEENYMEHKRAVAIKVLGQKTYLSMDRIAKLLEHPTHGDIIKTITLQELLDVNDSDEEVEEEETEAAAPKKRGRKKSKKKTKKKTKKKSKKKTKKKTKKKSKKKTKTKKPKKSKGGQKADAGKKKPRLDYDTGCKEVLSAMRAIKDPASNGQLVATTGYTPVQVRAFLKRLEKDKKVKRKGTGKATKYQVS